MLKKGKLKDDFLIIDDYLVIVNVVCQVNTSDLVMLGSSWNVPHNLGHGDGCQFRLS